MVDFYGIRMNQQMQQKKAESKETEIEVSVDEKTPEMAFYRKK